MNEDIKRIAMKRINTELAKRTEANTPNNALLMMLLKQAQISMPARAALLEMLSIMAGVTELLASIAHDAQLQIDDMRTERRHSLHNDVGTLHTQVTRMVYLSTQLHNTGSKEAAE
jgi:hypothetical protein